MDYLQVHLRYTFQFSYQVHLSEFDLVEPILNEFQIVVGFNW